MNDYDYIESFILSLCFGIAILLYCQGVGYILAAPTFTPMVIFLLIICVFATPVIVLCGIALPFILLGLIVNLVRG